MALSPWNMRDDRTVKVRGVTRVLPLCLLAAAFVMGCSEANCSEDINLDTDWEVPGAATAHKALEDWVARNRPRPPSSGWRTVKSARVTDVVFEAGHWRVKVGQKPAGGFVVYAVSCSTG